MTDRKARRVRSILRLAQRDEEAAQRAHADAETAVPCVAEVAKGHAGGPPNGALIRTQARKTSGLNSGPLLAA